LCFQSNIPDREPGRIEGRLSMKTYCFALDLEDDPALIEKYRWYHRPENIWAEVLESIKGDGILSQEIYLTGNRLVMILQTADDFSLEAKMDAHKNNPQMQKWEDLMWKYQRPLPTAKPGEKWVLMEKIFDVH
jgi:L-rhamnose mutarotase